MLAFLIKHWLTALTTLVSGLALLNLARQDHSGRFGISPLDTVLLINRSNAIVIDVRENNTSPPCVIPKAIHVPLAELETRISTVVKKTNRAVVCICHTGRSAKNAVALLRKAGYTEAYSLDGGLVAWQKAGL